MADVTDRTDRGQMMIITALVIAILFVGLALVLNSAIYTENLSTRETGEQSSAVLQERHTVEQDLQLQIDRANEQILEDGTEYGDATSFFELSSATYGESRTNELALAGRIISVHTDEPREGSRINQETEGNFTAGNEIEDQPDWTLAENVTEAGTFEMRLNEEALLQFSDGLISDGTIEHILDAAFHVKVSTENEEWRIFVFQEPGGSISVVTQKGERGDILDETLSATVGDRCETDSPTATIDLSNATLDGEACDQLEFYQTDVTGQKHTIEYQNARSDLDALDLSDLLSLDGLVSLSDLFPDSPTVGDRVNGTYEIIVDRPQDNLDPDPYYASATTGEPTAQSIIYSASIDVLYRNVAAELVIESHEIRWTKVSL